MNPNYIIYNKNLSNYTYNKKTIKTTLKIQSYIKQRNSLHNTLLRLRNTALHDIRDSNKENDTELVTAIREASALLEPGE